MAFLIAFVVIVWFFGMTLFNMKPLAVGFNSLVANVFMKGRYEARVDDRVVDAKDNVYRIDVSKLCASALVIHPTEHITCYWRDKPLPGIGFLSQ